MLLRKHAILLRPSKICSSKATQDRAREAKAISLNSVDAVVEQSDCILSIVPPRDAIATAERVRDAIRNDRGTSRRRVLCYVDFNAISPNRALEIERLFDPEHVKFMDGGVSTSCHMNNNMD